MRNIWIPAILIVLSLGTPAQEVSSKPMVSNNPITSDQIAVYRAVLSDFLKGSDNALNLANITDPIDVTDQTCLRGMDGGVIKEAASVVHRLAPELVAGTRVVLVDPDRQQKAVDENDPQKLIRSAIDQQGKVTDEQLDESIKNAFRTALFTLSEIVFDNQHRRAVVAYSFTCGMLCGNGNTLALKKIGNTWKVAKRCGGWAS